LSRRVVGVLVVEEEKKRRREEEKINPFIVNKPAA
jgi:hypothetical protein